MFYSRCSRCSNLGVQNVLGVPDVLDVPDVIDVII